LNEKAFYRGEAMLKYINILNDLRNQIIKGALPANHQLPFEKDLCTKYNVSKMTVKKALDILVTEGLIVKKRGAGSFVKNIPSDDMDRLLIANQFRGVSALYSNHNVTSKLLYFEIITSDEITSSRLNLVQDAFVYKIIRVRYVDDVPMCIEKTFMPIEVIPGLRREHALQSIYSYIQEGLGLKIQSAHRTISVRKSTTFEQEHLLLVKHDPVAIVEQVAYLDNSTSFEYSVSIHHYDRFSFETVIIR
jgi:GntR family transcriptional regulator